MAGKGKGLAIGKKTSIVEKPITGNDDDNTLNQSASTAANRINGGDGNDQITGSAFADRINAGDGDDTVKGGAGDDVMFGNDGTDTAAYDGSIFNFTWEEGKGNTLTVTDHTGAEGIDTLKHFEYLQFGDFTFDLNGPNAALILADDQETDEDNAATFSIQAWDFDGGAPSITAISVTGGGSVTATATGALSQGMGSGTSFDITYDPSGAYETLAVGETATETVTVEVDDGQGNISTKDFTVTITGVNDAPTLAAAATAAVEDGSSVDVDLAALGADIDSDDDGASLTYSVSGTPAEGSASISGTTLTFDPGADFQDLAVGETRDVVIGVTATDAHGAAAVNTVTVTVTGTNDAPTLAAAATAAVEDGPSVDVDLAALGADIDSDDDGASLTYSVSGTPAEGSASISGTTLTFDPGADFQDLAVGETRDVVIGITATDAHGAAAVNTVTVTVTGTNDAPTASDGSGSVSEDGTLVATGNLGAADVDGDSLSYSIQGGGSGAYGNLTVDQNGTWTYTLNNGAANVQALGAGEVATEAFTIQVSDGNGGSVAQTATITIAGENDAPTAAAISAPNTTEDAGVANIDLLATASDADSSDDLDVTNVSVSSSDGRALAYSVNAETGAFSFNAGQYNDLAVGESATVIVNYDITDGNGGSVANTATIVVEGRNDAPTVASAIVVGDADQVVIDFTGILDAGIYAGAYYTENGFIFDATGNHVDRNNVMNWHDGGANPGDNDIVITHEDGLAFDLVSMDVNQNSGLQVQSGAGNVAISGTGNKAIGIEGVTSARLETSGISEVDNLVLALGGGVSEDEADFSVDLLQGASDPDTSDVLNVANLVITSGDGSGVSQNGNTLDVSPNAYNHLAEGETETIVVSYDIVDGNGGSVPQTVTITISGENDAPTLTAAATAAVEDGPSVDVDLAALGADIDSDDDGASLTYSVSGTPAEGSASISGTTLTFDPGADFQDLAVGETRDVVIGVTATDAHGAAAVSTVTVTVTGTNDAPVAIWGGMDRIETGRWVLVPLSDLVSDVDLSDSHTLTNVQILSGGGLVTAESDGSGFVWRNNGDFNSLSEGVVATTIVQYTVEDSSGASVTGTAEVTVTGVNDKPQVQPLTVSGDEDTAIAGVVTGTDVDSDDTLTFSVASGAANGSVAMNADGSFTYTPNANFNGTDSFTFVANDGLVDSNENVVTINVAPVNDAPVADPVVVSGDEDTVISGQITGSDIDGDALTFSLVGTPSNGSVTLNADGSFDYTPDANFNGSDSFAYVANDGTADSLVQLALVNVAPVNDAPTASDGSGSVSEDGTLVATGNLGAADVDGDSLSYSVQGGGTGTYGSMSVDANGNWTYTLNNGAANVQALDTGDAPVDSFIFNVSDGNGGTATANVDVTVNGQDDLTLHEFHQYQQQDQRYTGQNFNFNFYVGSVEDLVDGRIRVTVDSDLDYYYNAHESYNIYIEGILVRQNMTIANDDYSWQFDSNRWQSTEYIHLDNEFSDAQLDQWFADGVLQVRVDLSNGVNTFTYDPDTHVWLDMEYWA